MKRYSPDSDLHFYEMREDFDGEWVRYEDAQAEIERLEQENAELRDHEQKLYEWKREGEKLAKRNTANVSFSIGAWWADRPWRHLKTGGRNDRD